MRIGFNGEVIISVPCDACGKHPTVPIGKGSQGKIGKSMYFIKSAIHICQDCAIEALEKFKTGEGR